MAQKRKTVAEMRDALDEVARSGLSLWAYARERGISYQRLAHWRRRVRGKSARGGSRRAKPPVFVEAFARSEGAEGRFEVELRSGTRIVVPARFDAGALRALLAALEPPC
jgi:hypothetical protein